MFCTYNTVRLFSIGIANRLYIHSPLLRFLLYKAIFSRCEHTTLVNTTTDNHTFICLPWNIWLISWNGEHSHVSTRTRVISVFAPYPAWAASDTVSPLNCNSGNPLIKFSGSKWDAGCGGLTEICTSQDEESHFHPLCSSLNHHIFNARNSHEWENGAVKFQTPASWIIR